MLFTDRRTIQTEKIVIGEDFNHGRIVYKEPYYTTFVNPTLRSYPPSTKGESFTLLFTGRRTFQTDETVIG